METKKKCPYEPIKEPKPYKIGHTNLRLTKEAIKESKLKKIEAEQKLNYKSKDWFIRPDMRGYYKVEDLLPLEFDLVQVKTQRGVYPAWWTGTDWWCRQKFKDDEIIAWRRHDTPDDFVLPEED